MTTTEEEKLQITLDRLYKCRDLEISNLWQRTAFLSTFIILAFSGYGVIAYSFANKNYDPTILHFLAFILSFLSSIVSLLWVLMGKASKAWYEVYESAITCYERNYYNKLSIPFNYRMGKMLLPDSYRDDLITSTKAGAYSPSKINIFIAQFCMVCWIILNISHLLLTLYHLNISTSISICWLSIMGFSYIAFLIYIVYFIKESNQSGFLTNNSDIIHQELEKETEKSYYDNLEKEK